MKGPRTSWFRAFVSSDRDNRYAETSLYSARERKPPDRRQMPPHHLPVPQTLTISPSKTKMLDKFNPHTSKSLSPNTQIPRTDGAVGRTGLGRDPNGRSLNLRLLILETNPTPIAFSETTTPATARDELRRAQRRREAATSREKVERAAMASSTGTAIGAPNPSSRPSRFLLRNANAMESEG